MRPGARCDPPRPDGLGAGEVLLRRARASDAAAIATLHLAARRQAMPYLPELHTEDEVRAWVAASILPNAVWVAEIAGEVAAYMALKGTEVEHLYVAPRRQSCDVGSVLLSKAKELNPGRLQLYAFQRNARARAFYEARGFAAVALSDGTGNEEKEPDVRYEWTGAD
ncbi:MAG TPA: GNAT family N-acetyltransferase, partial [Steroidobacteraceae bacterium]|nr:GNAT family N-acetyltransferase [Steroidobacteraceae bacterium]